MSSAQGLLSCRGGHGAEKKAEMGPEIFSTQCCPLLQHEEVGFTLQTCTQNLEPPALKKVWKTGLSYCLSGTDWDLSP